MERIKNDLIESIKILDKGVLSYKDEEIVDLYLNAKDEIYRNAYISIILLRYFDYTNFMRKKFHNLELDSEDYFILLFEIISKVIKMLPWKNKDNSLYNKPNAFRIALNKSLNSVLIDHYRGEITDKRKASRLTTSLNVNYQDNEYEWIDCIQDETRKHYLDIQEIIGEYIKRNNLSLALIIENICYGNCIAYTYENSKKIPSFSKYHFNNTLVDLDDKFASTFANEYNIKVEKVEVAINKLKSLSRQQLTKTVNNLLKVLATNDKIKEFRKCF